MTLGSKSYTVNGVTKTLDVPSKVLNGRTLMPIRAIAESFGADVDWNQACYLVHSLANNIRYLDTKTPSSSRASSIVRKLRVFTKNLCQSYSNFG